MIKFQLMNSISEDTPNYAAMYKFVVEILASQDFSDIMYVASKALGIPAGPIMELRV